MTDQVVVVTPPDDVSLADGFRILCVDLTTQQAQIVSDAVKLFTCKETVIVYVWRTGNSTEWLIDKKQRSQIILFNAESENEFIAGYMTAQPMSYYFGVLKNLQSVNTCAIYDKDQLISILERLSKIYEKK